MIQHSLRKHDDHKRHSENSDDPNQACVFAHPFQGKAYLLLRLCDTRAKPHPAGAAELSYDTARESFTCRFQCELDSRIRGMNSLKVQVEEYAAVCRSHSHQQRPTASDESGGVLDGCKPPVIVWTMRDFAPKPERRHQPTIGPCSSETQTNPPRLHYGSRPLPTSSGPPPGCRMCALHL